MKASAVVFCVLLTGAWPVRAQTAADGPVIDVPVPGGTAIVSRLLGVDPPPPTERFVPELVRRLYDVPGDLDVRKRLSALAADESAPDSQAVPMPLPLATWSRVLDRDVSPQDLFAAIMSDRQAALLAYGLSALDPQTLAYLASRPLLVTTLRARGAGIFAAFGRSLVVHGGRLVTQGASHICTTPWRSSTRHARDLRSAFGFLATSRSSRGS